MRHTDDISLPGTLTGGSGWVRDAAANADHTAARLMRALEPGPVSPESALGSALVEIVRHVLRGELQARFSADAAPRSPWMTPPVAARHTRVPVKTIRAWARMGRIPKRLKNRSADPKQQKYLVNVDDVVAVAEQVAGAPAETSDRIELQQRAEERAAQVLAARAAKER